MKNIIHILLILAMVLVPLARDVRAEQLPDDISGNYDFEEYQIGEIPKNWSITAASGSEIAVDVDKVTGSKALKMIIGPKVDSNLAIMNFDKTAGTRVKVSYDMRFQNHSRWGLDLEGFGSVYSDETRVIRNTLYADSYIGFGGWGSADTNIGLLTGLNDNKNYFKVEMYLDFETQKYTTYIDGVLKFAGGGNDFVFQNRADSVNRLVFSLRPNTNASGSSNDGTPENNGVYWLDNVNVETASLKVLSATPKNGEEAVSVKKKTIGIALSGQIDKTTVTAETLQVYENDARVEPGRYTVDVSENTIGITFAKNLAWESVYRVVLKKGINLGNPELLGLTEDYIMEFTTMDEEDGSVVQPVLFSENFEKYDEGTVATSIAGIAGSGFKIEKDEKGSKAIKMSGIGNLDFKFDNTTEEKVIISFGFRSQKHVSTSANIVDFGLVSGKGASGSIMVVRSIVYNDSMLTYFAEKNPDANRATGDIITSDKYQSMRYEIDMNKKSADVYVNNEMKGEFQFWDTSANTLDLLQFANVNSDAIYWIDNVTIEYEHLKIVSSEPKNGAVRVPEDKLIKIDFDDRLKAVGQGDVKIYQGAQQLSDYTVKASEKSMTVEMKEKMIDNETYRLVLSSKITGIGGRTLMAPVTISFVSNLKKPFIVVKSTSGSVVPGNSFTAKYMVKNISNSGENVAIVLSVFADDGSMIAVKAKNMFIMAGDEGNIAQEVVVPDGGKKIVIYLWKGNMLLNPIMDEIEHQ